MNFRLLSVIYLHFFDHLGKRVAYFVGLWEHFPRLTYNDAASNFSLHDKTISSSTNLLTYKGILSGDIHEEVETHNHMLDRMGNDMDSSRGVLSGTMDKFKMVFETKSSQRMFTLVASFVVIFLVIYYLTR
ncbi:hypothetical protein D8674_027217 [Pyrus ussuriensis x Pyrus communis]|uniref:t-SNARE coiled-coil homology domain-containing protein n=1 Tax=Pyrus ussuriensis x Pyrus communis TaxID=2448454 RepID=A0A5N5IC43_9ROSA|nr:hypothetical protein D8674_027217 [Pyrus ussuriensis x Pyrus communis]